MNRLKNESIFNEKPDVQPVIEVEKKENVSKTILTKIYFFSIAIFIFCSIIAVRILFLQQFDYEKWLKKRDTEKIIAKQIKAYRGSILADDESVLATTIHRFKFAIDATVIKDNNFGNLEDSIDALCGKLERLCKSRGEEYNKAYFKQKIAHAIKTKDRHLYLTSPTDLYDYKEQKTISKFPIFNRGRLEGGLLIEQVTDKRFYPLDDLCKVTLGSLDENGKGNKGLEFAFNAALEGKSGQIYVQKNREIPINSLYEADPKDGNDIITTINVNMQDLVSTALSNAIEKNKAKGGVAILMEVKTGQIKAIANYPETFNNALATQLEPGSTFKIASAIAALEDNIITPEDTVETGRGELKFSDRTMTDIHAYGKIPFKQAIEKSSNIAIAELINKNYSQDPQKFIAQLEKMGILSCTDFKLTGEPAPYIIKPENKNYWSNVTLPWLSIGYNVKLTPLQTLNFFNAIANNGTMMTPYIVTSIKDGDKVIEQYSPKVLKEQICSEKTREIIHSMLCGVVETGTAKNIRGSHYKIAGKTGTALIVADGIYHKKYRSSFVGYFPADAPEYSCYVMIDEPQSGAYYGSEVAAPIFKEIADNIVSTQLEKENNPQVPIARTRKQTPSAPTIANLNDAKEVYQTLSISSPDAPNTEYVRIRNKGQVAEMRPFNINRRKTPTVVGMSAKDAVAILENMGYKVAIKGHGHVKKQSIAANSKYKRGQLIVLSLG